MAGPLLFVHVCGFIGGGEVGVEEREFAGEVFGEGGEEGAG